MSEYLRVCERAARAAGAVLLDWQGRINAREKGPADLITEADLAAQATVRDIVLTAFPDHDFLGEEDGLPASGEPIEQICPSNRTNEEPRYRWIVDPLDGTTNYVHGMPCFCVSIGLERDGEPVLGAVLDPVAQELFTATQGDGARLNGRLINASDVDRLDRAMVAASFPPNVPRGALAITHFVEVLHRCQAIRRLGSAALSLAYVAAGRLDAYWATTVNAWDVAAGIVLVREAGGVVTAVDGGPIDLDRPKFLASSTPGLHEELLGVLQQYGK